MNRWTRRGFVGGFWALGIVAFVPSCNPPAGSGGTGGPRVSSSKVSPGEYITISHDDIVAGLPVDVEFRASGGSVISVKSYDVEDGRVRVAVPPFIDLGSGALTAGEYAVSLHGMDGEALLEVEDLPALDDVEPGSILRLFLAAAIEDYQTTIDNLTAIEAAFPGGDAPATIAGLNDRIASLQATVDELDATGQLVVDLGVNGLVKLSANELSIVDRVLVSILVGFGEVPSSAKGNANYRDAGDCIQIFCPPPIGNFCPPPPEGRDECLYQVLRDIRDQTRQVGVKLAGYVGTGVGAVVTVFGTVATSAEVALTGVLVSVANGVVSFTDAALAGTNTDDFLQNAGEPFNAGLEIISQTGRGLLSAAATGAEGLENLVSDVITNADRFVTGMDLYNSLKCSEDEPGQKLRPQLLTVEEVGFCTITRPAGCDNTCSLAFNAVCEDGGEGASGAACAIGTDCTDCGPRGDDTPPTDDAGACCALNGTCSSMSATACSLSGGGFQGTGSSCSPNPCPQPAPTGACCVAGVCDPKRASECQSEAGVYSGDGTACASVTCAPPLEYVVWYTGNVSCWEAPLLYIDTRDDFNEPESAASYPGGGIDFSVPLQKVELQGGFASVEEAQAWVCPQFEMFFYHNWCSPHYFAMGQWWLPGGLGCDLSDVPHM